MNSALRVLREELNWLEAARHNAVKELSNPAVPAGMAKMLLDRLELEICEIEWALEDLCRHVPAMLDERPQMELFG